MTSPPWWREKVMAYYTFRMKLTKNNDIVRSHISVILMDERFVQDEIFTSKIVSKIE